MKVLHILNELKHSGAEVMLQSAHQNFRRNGIESHILSTGDEVGEYAAILRQTGYCIHHIEFQKNARFFIELRLLLTSEKFNVVHIHTERAFIWYILLAKLAGVPTVIRTFHNVFLFTSYLRWKRQLQRKLSRKLFGAIHTAIGDSVLAVEKERFHNGCTLIRNWTDANKFRPPNKKERTEARGLYQLEPDDFVIVTIGECSAVKNHLAVFAAIKKTKDFLDRKRVVLLHVGEGTMLQEEQLYVRQYRIQPHCRFLGTLNDVRPCLAAADGFVMTSKYEGLPIAALEAMSTGLPSILYNVGGLRDLLQDGKGGLLIQPDEDSLVDALLLMSQSLELRRRCAQEAREKILGTYSLEDSVDKLIRLYTMGRLNVDDNSGAALMQADL